MKLFSSVQQVVSQGGWRGVICIGNFDGVHLGHVGLLHCAKAFGPLLALTFEPHPMEILFPERAPKRIATPEQKQALLAQQGVAAVLTQTFDTSFAAMSAAQFESLLFEALGAHTIAVGANFTYGARCCGNTRTLHEASRRLGRQLFIFSELKVAGVVVSSSQIRTLVSAGDVAGAQQYLGRPFELEGDIMPGAQRGREMGFPTANIGCKEEVLMPKPGVYAVEFALAFEGLASEGRWRGGVANLGHKPTFAAPMAHGKRATRAELEVHIPGASGNWYGKKARIRFLSHLRDERRFASTEDLKAQIKADIEAAQPFLKP